MIASLLVGLALCAAPQADAAPAEGLVPRPLRIAAGSASLPRPARLLVRLPDASLRPTAEAFGEALTAVTGTVCVFPPEEGDAELRVTLAEGRPVESYGLRVGADGVQVEVSSVKGFARATATLLQLFGSAADVPGVEIEDAPRNAYRSFMVDVARNPHGLPVLKATVDLLWFYKLDSLHLHLTDDQLFAFPSEAFPKLQTKRGAISREGFRELDRYAAARGISVIPELEVPGHSSILRREYPDVFGETSTQLATEEKALEGIRTLIDEMIDVFASSPYVHVGGDEAYDVPQDAQRALINLLHEHVESRGKRTLVWEGPPPGEGEDRVDPDVIHLNWRTIDFPADRMLAAGHPVVNAAWDPLYLVDHYPRNNFTMASPEWIYRRLDRYRFGHFNPGMPTFANPVVVEPTPAVIGYCMPWWEGREENYLELVVPRVISMAAVAWSEPRDRDFARFRAARDAAEDVRLRAFHPVRIDAEPLAVPSAGVFHREVRARLNWRGAPIPGAVIRYTLDGSEPTAESAEYEDPLVLSATTCVRAAAFADGRRIRHASLRTLVHVDPLEHLALGKPVTTSATAGPRFCVERLTDGGTGNLDYYLGYPAGEQPIDVTVDLGEAREVGRVLVHTYTNGSSFESYEVLVSADDASSLERVADRRECPEEITSVAEHAFPPRAVRYVRVRTYGHKGQVFDSFSRITEIEVRP